MKLTPGVPRLIRWILTIGFFFLVLMTLMRIVLYMFFNKQGHAFPDVAGSFLLGLRFEIIDMDAQRIDKVLVHISNEIKENMEEA